MASLIEIQGQQVRQHEQMLALTAEISDLNKKVAALHQDALPKDPVLSEIARQHGGRSAQQVAVRYQLQRGVSVLLSVDNHQLIQARVVGLRGTCVCACVCALAPVGEAG